MTQLVVFRAVQGIGAGGLFPLSLAVIGNIVPPRDRGRWQGLIGAVFAAVVDHRPCGRRLHRRQRELALGLPRQPAGRRRRARRHLRDDAAARAAHRPFDRLARRRRARRGDRRAAARARLGRQGISLGQRARGRRASSSPPSLLAVFALIERRAREPILPFEILRNPIVAGSIACMALVGMAMFGTISYVPLFVQGVIGTSATSSGVVLTPLMLGAVTTSILTGQLVSRTGPLPLERRPRPARAGAPGCCSSGGWTSRRRTARRRATWSIAGIGIGSMMQVFVLSVQNAVAARAHRLGDRDDAVRAPDRRDPRRRRSWARSSTTACRRGSAQARRGRRHPQAAARGARRPRERDPAGVPRGVDRLVRRLGDRRHLGQGAAPAPDAGRDLARRGRRGRPGARPQ